MDQKDPKITVHQTDGGKSKKVTPPKMVFKVAGEHARELSEWSERSFESRKLFGQSSPRF